MATGEVRFNTVGQAAKSMAIQDGAFSGEAFVGANQIDVIWEKDGPPHPMESNVRLKVNIISNKYWAPASTLRANIGPEGASDLKFDVKSKRK
jgi:hypothetical protein